MNSIVYVGMDVHKEQYTITVEGFLESHSSYISLSDWLFPALFGPTKTTISF